MRMDTESLEEIEVDLVYLARTLKEALKLEGLFNENGIDYLVEPGPYTAGFLIRRELTE